MCHGAWHRVRLGHPRGRAPLALAPDGRLLAFADAVSAWGRPALLERPRNTAAHEQLRCRGAASRTSFAEETLS